ncbi:alanine racemase [Microbacterium sp. 18062]|uniref:alanine racemase n=1 Tax=Microbacterium sp. 18062 TaxID=2681410 RepID=UPI00135B7C05|nr:alanine racemase [Microbacterium sp. 18062]
MSATLRIDLTAFEENLRAVRDRVAPAETMLVVKDDAYGHGLAPIVSRAWLSGVRWFGAFDVETGVQVRRELGRDARVFSWMVFGAAQTTAAVSADLDIGVGDAATLEEVAAAAQRAGAVARVHLKVDTGLHRNGVRPEDWAVFVDRAVELAARRAIDVVGVWSHIAEASDDEDDAARARYEVAVAQLRARGVAEPLRHLSASAAAFARPQFRYDIVRIGAFCYGIRPAGGPDEQQLGLAPVATLEADVIALENGATRLGVGSCDGLPSTLAGRVHVRTPGGDRRLLGIEDTEALVESWPDAAIGQRVQIFGGGAPSQTDLAEKIDSIGEEIAVRISPLVARCHR